MKTRKILAIVLSALMLLLPLSVGVFAEDAVTPITFTRELAISLEVSAANFAVTASVNLSPFSDFSYYDGTGALSVKIDSVYAYNADGNKIYYLNNENSPEFFEIFNDGEHLIYVNLTTSIDSSKAAGIIYTGISIVDKDGYGSRSDIEVTVDSLYSTTLTSSPATTSYICGETFDPAGIAATVLKTSEYKAGASGTVVEYNAATAADFSFSPALTEKLNTTNTFVEVSYKGEVLGTVDINVAHAVSTDVVSLGKHNHGVNCPGCGATYNVEDHVVTSWKVGSEATFLTPETEVGTCDVCGETVTRTIPGTERYLVTFANNPGILAVISAIATFLQVIKSL